VSKFEKRGMTLPQSVFQNGHRPVALEEQLVR